MAPFYKSQLNPKTGLQTEQTTLQLPVLTHWRAGHLFLFGQEIQPFRGYGRSACQKEATLSRSTGIPTII